MSLPARSATAAAWARALRCAWKAATARRGRAATLGSIVVALLALAAPADAAARRIMVFGDSIAWGYVPRAEGPPSTRFPAEQRWPGVMAQALGPGWEVIEEALNGRVTDFTPNPAPVPLAGAGIDGGAYLPAAIASNLPLDLVVIALGTNDTGYKRSALAIGLDAMRLAVAVQDSAGGVATVYPAPAVLLVAPAPPSTTRSLPARSAPSLPHRRWRFPARWARSTWRSATPRASECFVRPIFPRPAASTASISTRRAMRRSGERSPTPCARWCHRRDAKPCDAVALAEWRQLAD
jgi:lysophospholipase L1-like esterase